MSVSLSAVSSLVDPESYNETLINERAMAHVCLFVVCLYFLWQEEEEEEI